MNKITKLQDVKDARKLKIILEDVNTMIKIMDLSIRSLLHYKKYTASQECISVLKSNKSILEIHYNKNKKLIEKLK